MNVVNESQRRELLDECQLKEVQIKELQSKLSDAREARSRQQTRLLQITSIAEARSVMKHLFSLVSESLFYIVRRVSMWHRAIAFFFVLLCKLTLEPTLTRIKSRTFGHFHHTHEKFVTQNLMQDS